MQTFLDIIMEKKYYFTLCIPILSRRVSPCISSPTSKKKYSLIDAIILRDDIIGSLVGFPPRTVAMVFQGPTFKNKTKLF